MIFFTADHHFGHANIIRFCNRPFKNSEEMDQALIQRWNEVVSNNDTVYHLGDFTLGENAQKYFSQLKGKIKVLPGSHDWRWWGKNYVTASSYRVIYCSPIEEFADKSIGFGEGRFPNKSNREGLIVLCHYAMLTWSMSHYGSYHLFGHSHGKLKGQPNSFDIGVDCTDFYPLSLEQVLERFRQ